jgi:cytochrome c-type biogenesis protein CcmE
MREASRSPAAARRTKFLVGAAVIFLTLAMLVGWAMGRPGSTSFYLTTSELSARGPLASSDTLRVNGRVVPGSLRREGLRSEFLLSDGKTEVRIVTSRPLPDTLKARSDVVAEGSFDDGRFHASQVLAKCPSKFKPQT